MTASKAKPVLNRIRNQFQNIEQDSDTYKKILAGCNSIETHFSPSIIEKNSTEWLTRMVLVLAQLEPADHPEYIAHIINKTVYLVDKELQDALMVQMHTHYGKPH